MRVLLCALMVTASVAFAPTAPTLRTDNKVTWNLAASSTNNKELGSSNVIFGGEPTERGKTMNHREEMRGVEFYRVSGEPVTMDELLDDKSVSIAIFLRSLG